MTIEINNGWAQWDWQIGTFRAQIGGEIIGTFTGDINSAAELAARLLPDCVLSNEHINELDAEKLASEEGEE